MPSNDNKGTEKSSKKNVNINSHKKKKVSVGWIFGMTVLILIAVSFVAAPAISAIVGQSVTTSLTFGSYDGEEIAYTQDSYFYDQYQAYGSQYEGSTSNSDLALYNIWKSAFDSTVYYVAINQMADDIGILTTENTINDAIINSGYYNVDGKFSKQAYEETSIEQKESIRKSITRTLPYNTVLSDVSTALTSDAETQYVVSMADNTRSFDYVVFDSSSYPKELAAQYGLTNPQLFYSIDLSIISVETEEDANNLISQINSGSSFSDVATESSLDSYAANGGEIGVVPFYAVQNNFKDPQEAIEILSGTEGSVFGPLESASGWAIYKLNATPVAADYTDEDTINMIRTYIASNDESIMDSYLLEKANEFVASIDDDFEAAAEAAQLEVNAVSSTAKNISDSQYMSSFSYSDTNGTLASAATDETVLKQLFDAEVGSTLDPLKVSTSYVVVNVASESTDSGMGEYLASVYPYYASQHNTTDLQYAIMASDKLEDNFMTVFIEKILGSAN
ncbi:MAG: SurA N-terminal domain-containing protein [Sphaerochaetaceae bacterium]|nr:SurA N-terminal domain-containing protein [Sphaerochaetaceae bacterium]